MRDIYRALPQRFAPERMFAVPPRETCLERNNVHAVSFLRLCERKQKCERNKFFQIHYGLAETWI
jgi:hypothetical protein